MPKKKKKSQTREKSRPKGLLRLGATGRGQIWQSFLVFWVFGAWQRQTLAKSMSAEKRKGNSLRFHNTFVTAGFARPSLLKWNGKEMHLQG